MRGEHEGIARATHGRRANVYSSHRLLPGLLVLAATSICGCTGALDQGSDDSQRERERSPAPPSAPSDDSEDGSTPSTPRLDAGSVGEIPSERDAGPVGGRADDAGTPASGDCELPKRGLELRFVASEGVELEGGGVKAWRDTSGANNAVADQSEAGRRPTVRANAIAGHPVVRFDGRDDFLTFTRNLVGRTHMTIVAIASTWEFQPSNPNPGCGGDDKQELNCSGTDQSILMFPEPGFVSGGVIVGAGQKEVNMRFGTGAQYGGYKAVHVRPQSIGAAYTWTTALLDGPKRRLYVEGLRFPNESFEPTASGDGAIQKTEGFGWIGRGRFGENERTFWSGDLAELVMYDTTLTGAELTALDEYVKCTYFLDRP